MSAGGPTLGHQQPAVQKEVTQFMEPGHWFVSLYNDDGDPQEVTCLISLSRDMTLNCPRGCNANGECILGRCQCKSGFGGDDCSESKWLVLSLGPVSFVCQPPSRSFPSSILWLTIFSPPPPPSTPHDASLVDGGDDALHVKSLVTITGKRNNSIPPPPVCVRVRGMALFDYSPTQTLASFR